MADWVSTDALIFDMDGTLWDAVDSYCEIWNRTFRDFGVDCTVGRDVLTGQREGNDASAWRCVLSGCAGRD